MRIPQEEQDGNKDQKTAYNVGRSNCIIAAEALARAVLTSPWRPHETTSDNAVTQKKTAAFNHTPANRQSPTHISNGQSR